MKSEYFLFDLIILAAPLLSALFYPKIVWLKMRALFLASLFVSFPFILWDQWVTDYFWSFNPSYTLGIKVGKLPFEEILFFLIIPFACLFLWVNLKKILSAGKSVNRYWLWLSGGGFLTAAFCFKNLAYSSQIFALAGFLIILDSLGKKPLLSQKRFWLFSGIILGLTLIFNGYLTWRPVVLYNSQVKTNWQIGPIPVEDFIYGLILNGAFIWVYEKYQKQT